MLMRTTIAWTAALLIAGLMAAGCATQGKACPTGKCPRHTMKGARGAACAKCGKAGCTQCGDKKKAACKCGKKDCPKCARGAGKGAHDAEARVNTPTLATLIEKGVPMTLLDARTGEYDDGRRIPGAKALAPSATAEEAANAIPSKDALVVTYCANLQCPAGSKLAAQLKTLGYTNIIEYPHGIEGWVDAGHEVEQASTAN